MTILLFINGKCSEVPEGITVAAALAHAGLTSIRLSLSGQPRAAFCGMGQCQECRVTMDGRVQLLACMTIATDGMRVETQP